MAGPTLAPGDTLEYAWRSRSNWRLQGRPHRGQLQDGWNRFAARVAAPLTIPAPNSFEEFFVEHYWGYVRARDGSTREYKVAHEPWQVAAADTVTWDCDLAATYTTPLAEYLAVQPTNAIIADGAPVQLYRGRRL
jgi:hypothetical protein